VVAYRPVGSASSAFQNMQVLHDFVRVHVANDPREGMKGVTAQKVYALVTFTEVDTTVALADMLGAAAGAEARERAGARRPRPLRSTGHRLTGRWR
jgi:hypothetical protein